MHVDRALMNWNEWGCIYGAVPLNFIHEFHYLVKSHSHPFEPIVGPKSKSSRPGKDEPHTDELPFTQFYCRDASGHHGSASDKKCNCVADPSVIFQSHVSMIMSYKASPLRGYVVCCYVMLCYVGCYTWNGYLKYAIRKTHQ